MKKFFILFNLIVLVKISFAQLNVAPNPGITNFMNSLLGNGLTYSNVQVNCNNQAYGTFSNGNTTNIGLTNGVILATGNATNAIGPNNSGGMSTDFMTSCSDPQLVAVTGQSNLYDCCIIEFDVQSQCNQLQIRFVFGSEEYPEYVNSSVNDGFGFFVTGPGYTNYNMAQLPNGVQVSIDNVNAGTNNAYYVNNTGNTIQYDGFTTVITHTITITPCATYHIKLAIADAGDGVWDSGVFIDFITCSSAATVTASSTPSSCSTLGTATANVIGGVGPFSYSWNTTPVQNTQTAIGLSPGTYTVTVQDLGVPCAQPIQATTTVNGFAGSITVTPSSNSPLCIGQTLNLTVNTTTGATYSWTGPNGFTSTQQNPSITNVTAAHIGTYTVTVTDGSGCQGTNSVNVTVNPQPTVTPGSNSPICAGQTLNLTVNATAGATYSWTGPNGFTSIQQNPIITNVTTVNAGNYTVTVTANGCINTGTVNVVVNTLPNTTITPAGPFCTNNPNTFLAAVDPGGTWSGTGIVNAATGEFSPTTASAGIHTITYSIGGACPNSSTINIQVIANANAAINPAGPFCVADPAINLSAVQTGGVWSGTGITNAATGTFNPSVAGAGTHTITYTISGVCGDIQTTNISVLNQLPSTITPVGPFCVNATSITLQGASPGGTWSGTGITNTTTGTFDPSVAGAGTHTITYTTPGSCGTSSTTNIVINPLPQISFVADVTNGCLPLTVNLINNSTPQGVNCTWNINGVPSNNSCTVFTNTFTQAGCYNIGLQSTDANGCSNNQTLNNYICVSDIPQAEFTHNPTNATVLDPTVYFINQSTGADTYFWDFGGLGNSTQTHPNFTFPSNEPQTYVVCLIAANNAGCVDDVCHNVLIYNEFLVYAPNAFTPTQDGINDVFLPIVSGHDILSYELMIFNRWGELIFQTDVSTKGWDGTYKSMPAKEDVYVWKLKVKRLSDGKKFDFKGHVTLLK